MIKNKYITFIIYKIGENKVTAEEAKIIMNKRKYKIEMSGITSGKGDMRNEK